MTCQCLQVSFLHLVLALNFLISLQNVCCASYSLLFCIMSLFFALSVYLCPEALQRVSKNCFAFGPFGMILDFWWLFRLNELERSFHAAPSYSQIFAASQKCFCQMSCMCFLEKNFLFFLECFSSVKWVTFHWHSVEFLICSIFLMLLIIIVVVSIWAKHTQSLDILRFFFLFPRSTFICTLFSFLVETKHLDKFLVWFSWGL